MQTEQIFFANDQYAAVKPGEPIRLLPFGTLVKNGVKRLITPEFAKRFKLPHFKAPIKLGSHKDETPAGGFIVGLEVREDGLYGITEINDEGEQAFAKGAYRYHSPEVIWEGGFEDPQTGALIEGPLIVGDALLHSPHLGEAAALYTVETYINLSTEDNNMSETVSVPVDLWESIKGVFTKAPEPKQPEPETPEVDVEQYSAVVKERDAYEAKVKEYEAERERAERLGAIRKEFENDEFGAAFVELGKAAEAVDHLAGMTDEQRAWVVQQFKAMSKQIDEGNLTKEIGDEGKGDGNDDPVNQFNARVQAHAKEKGIEYTQALREVADAEPELYRAYVQGR